MDLSKKNKFTVLIADDQEIAQLVATEFMHQLGCIVEIANTGFDTLHLLKEKSYDLILLDLMMFDMDGFKVIRTIRDLNINTPIVIVSTYQQASMKQHALSLGIKHFITKPLTLPHCKKILETYGKDKVKD